MTVLAKKSIFPLLPIEVCTLIYLLITLGMALMNAEALQGHFYDIVWIRLAFVVVMSGFYYLHRRTHKPFFRLLRTLFPLYMLSYLYPETYLFSSVHDNLDHVFAWADEWLFGGQPALLFAQHFPQGWVSELFYMGYFSYYPLIVLTCLFPFFLWKKDRWQRRQLFERGAFIVVVSFFLYYLCYDLLPVAGPQYYFPVIGNDNVWAGFFPSIGTYFAHHTELIPYHPGNGFFQTLVEHTQAAGERPTAAFPSSHVGISTILMILLWSYSKRTAVLYAPLYCFLCGATVYIGAHYFVDVIFGLLTAVLCYALTAWLYRAVFKVAPFYSPLSIS